MDYFMSSDSRLCGFLVAKGCAVTRVEGPPYRRVFVFKQHEVGDLATRFYSGTELIEPQAYAEGMRHVKQLLFWKQPA